jgi:WD40 repeat protein
VWNVVTGTCDQVLGDDDFVESSHTMTIFGSRLVSSLHECIKVWAMRTSGPWTCERTLRSKTGAEVSSLAAWQGKVVSGYHDTRIRVWDVETGALEATLGGHRCTVSGLAVHGDRLLSASWDGTIRAWALGTWALLQTVDCFGQGMGDSIECLAVSRSQLVSGADRGVLVWGLETLDLEYVLPHRHSANTSVNALFAAKGCVWAGVGSDVAVFGLGAPGGDGKASLRLRGPADPSQVWLGGGWYSESDSEESEVPVTRILVESTVWQKVWRWLLWCSEAGM